MHGQQQGGGSSHGHLRFYIIMTTVIVGVLLVLLLMNDSDDFSLTSAIVGIGKENQTTELTESTAGESDDSPALSKRGNKEVDIQLSFDQIPSVHKEAKVQEIELKFDDLSTKINVNDDKLELNNLQEVTLTIKEFNGELDLDDLGFSLDGSAKSIEVNGISLSAKGELKISFSKLDYDYVRLENVELQELELPTGDGQLTAAEKLTYTLEQDKVDIFYFNGRVIADRLTETRVNLEGVAKGITVSGALVNFDLG